MKTSPFGLKRVKVIALSALDADRANDFYGNKLGLEPDVVNGEVIGWMLGDIRLMPKTDWQQPTSEPNPRITIEVEDAFATETALKDAGVTIEDPVQVFDEVFRLGSFLDSEGNKFWFCSKK